MSEADRDQHREAISLEADLREALFTPGGVDDSVVWDVYARIEKLIALMKFRTGFETPGVFTKLPDASDPYRLLEEASELLGKGAEEISSRRPVDAIGTLRKARNNLRSYLSHKSKAATRAESHVRRKPATR